MDWCLPSQPASSLHRFGQHRNRIAIAGSSERGAILLRRLTTEPIDKILMERKLGTIALHQNMSISWLASS